VGLDIVDEAVGARVVPTGQLITPQLRLNDLGQLLAKLNTPLVIGIDIPNHPLGEDLVLIQGYRRKSNPE